MTLPLNNPCRTSGIGNEVSVEKDRKRTEYIWYGDKVQYEEVTQNGAVSPKVNMWGMTGIAARNNDIFSSDAHGNTDEKYSGTAVKRYVYDAYGNEISESGEDDNPYRYCGENYDEETGLYYLRARYYDPSIGRFMSEDPAQDGLNWYVYCDNNSIMNIDPTGLIPWEDASEIIKRNAQGIKNAGAWYGVNPAIIAACIYTELYRNVNWVDELTDVPGFWLDTSVGIGQVKISTAKMLEDNGYIAKTEYSHAEVYAGQYITYWNAPGVGEVWANSREEAIAYRLLSEGECVNYVAAYLKYWQDRWKQAYPEIDGRTAILATLFNQGEINPPHSNPVPNTFGEQAKGEYQYMRQLLGLE